MTLENLEPSDVFLIHDYIVDEYRITAGFQNRGMVEAVLAKIDFLNYEDIYKNGALLLEGLTRLHPFADGNKRTALQSLRQYFRQNGHSFSMPPDTAEFLYKIADTKENDPESTEKLVGEIEEWLQKNSHQNGGKP